MNCKGLLINQKNVSAMTEQEIVDYLEQNNIRLKEEEQILFPFCVLLSQQTKRADAKKIEYIRHKTVVYKYSALQAFETAVPEGASVLSQVVQMFNEKQDINGLEDGKGFIIPCLITLLDGTYNVRCVVKK